MAMAVLAAPLPAALIRLNLRTFILSHCVVDDWNSLPRKVVQSRAG